ncbi:MAG: ACP S-malonyltransferase [Gammaproteobacteria bacterium]|nr:ACP S-malonyltransferase [Gammaproteobacteria bacterium]
MSLAFIFPGQGSQSVGMLSELAQHYPQIKVCFEEASDVLGRDLWSLCTHGPVDELNQTQNTQPAMLTAGVAIWRLWQAQDGVVPSIMAGHSLGEYAALVCGGAMNFIDGVSLVEARAKYMQEAVPAGAGGMAAILGLDDDQVGEVCRDAADGEVLEAVNFNSPGQVVIAGTQSAVGRAVIQAKAAGAKRAIVLPVSVPSHCALMQPAADRLAARLADLDVKVPQIPIINNVDVEVANDAEAIKQALVRQLHSPVRWVESVQKMAAQGVDHMIEAGPGKVLTGLNKRIDRSITTLAIYDSESFNAALAAHA